MFSEQEINAAQIETERLTRELDITNADHIALWLEANMEDSPLGWLACRIVEAHEAALSTPPSSEDISDTLIERAKVVAWLRNGFKMVSLQIVDPIEAEHLADAIERGDHLAAMGE